MGRTSVPGVLFDEGSPTREILTVILLMTLAIAAMST